MAKSNSTWRNPWVIGIIVVLTIFVLANVVTIYISTTGVPGLVVDNYYERGEHYEKNMLKKLAQDPGWKMKLTSQEPIKMSQKQIINITVQDKEGKPVNRDKVIFYVYRPSDKNRDFSLPMQRIDDGLYEVAVDFPLPGVWDVLVSLPNQDVEVNLPKRIEVAK